MVPGNDAALSLQVLTDAEEMELLCHTVVSDRCRCREEKADLGLIMQIYGYALIKHYNKTVITAKCGK